MYYSAGTYEAFAHPEKPEGVDNKSAYIIGTGLAGLTAAFYLVRDGQMKGERIHLLEKLELAGGSCDGYRDITKGFYMRGGREMDNHFEVMWDTFRDVPSIETPGVSVLDEYYWLNKHDPNYSLCRASVNRGEDAHTDKQFKLDKESAMALSKLFLTPEKDLEDKKISDVLPDSFWGTNFWLYWQTMFAFQRWSSALEMKRYLCRYVHHIDGLPDFSALRFTKYNQYESMILPLVKYLESHGVQVEYGMDVKNVIIETDGDKKVAKQIVYVKDGQEQTIDLIEDDLVFITNGCCTDTSCYGDQTHAPDLSKVKNGAGESWDMWKAIAAQAKQAVQLGVLVGLFHGGHFIDVVILHNAHHFKRRALGAQDGAAQGQNAAEIVLGHLLVVPVDQAAVAVQDADDLHVVTHAGVQCFCYTADGGVQARTVAAGGQDTNTFFHSKALFPLSFRAADPEHTIYSIRVFRMRVGVKPSGQNFTCCRAAKAPGKKVCGKSKKVVDKDTLFGYNIPCQQR